MEEKKEKVREEREGEKERERGGGGERYMYSPCLSPPGWCREPMKGTKSLCSSPWPLSRTSLAFSCPPDPSST